jgi:RNA polymerase sigma-70 factor (ECF subfamily)
LGAGDILQETFITVFEKIAQYDPSKGAIDTWINRIAINTALKALRKKQTALVDIDLLPDIADEVPDENTTMDDISEEYLLGLIQALPVGYRTVFNLYVIDGFGHQEIADTLGISPQTSKSQLFKAKAMLRRNLTSEKTNLKNLYL